VGVLLVLAHPNCPVYWAFKWVVAIVIL